MAGKGAVSEQALAALEPRLASVLGDVSRRRENGELPFFALPYDEEAIAAASELARSLVDRFDNLVVLGIGGSALGTKAVLEAVPLTQRRAGAMRVEVVDNIDPSVLTRLLCSLDLERTCFNVISKSGQTAETMAQFMVVRDRLLAALGPDRYRDHLVVTTDPDRGELRVIVEEERLRSLVIPPGVGGRFSVLSAVGLLPVAAAGVDIGLMCEGARAMDARCSRCDPRSNPAAMHAGLLFLALSSKGAVIHVLMPYSDALRRITEWYAQLWAESLGKPGPHGEGLGQTPVGAVGATDQHSQVQLYMEGPRDKVVTFIRVEDHGCEQKIPRDYADKEGLAYLGGHGLGELLNMEQRATELALSEQERLSSLITIEHLDAAALGQLFQLFATQTLVMGGLLGVDPLDQPGVEAGKRLTYAMAGRAGFEDLAAAVSQRLAEKRKDLVLA